MSDEESAGSNDEEQEEEAGQFPVVNTGSSLRDVSVKTSGSTSIGDQNTINYHGQVHLTINQNIVIDNSSDPAALQNNILRLAIGGGQSSNAPHLPALDFISQVPVNAGRSVSINGVQVPAVEHHEVQEAGPSTTITELETTSLPEVQTVNSGTPSEASTEENASMTFLPIDNNRDVKDAGPPANITEPESTSMPVEQTVTSGSRNKDLVMAVASTSNLPIENTASEGEASGSAVVAFGSDLVTEPWWSRVTKDQTAADSLVDWWLAEVKKKASEGGKWSGFKSDNYGVGAVPAFRKLNLHACAYVYAGGNVFAPAELSRSGGVHVSSNSDGRISLGFRVNVSDMRMRVSTALVVHDSEVFVFFPSCTAYAVVSGLPGSLELESLKIEKTEMLQTESKSEIPFINLFTGMILTFVFNQMDDIKSSLDEELHDIFRKGVQLWNRL